MDRLVFNILLSTDPEVTEETRHQALKRFEEMVISRCAETTNTCAQGWQVYDALQSMPRLTQEERRG